VIQLYATEHDSASNQRSRRQLLGFTRVELPARSRQQIEVCGSLRPLARRDPVTRRWHIPRETYRAEAAQFWGDPEGLSLPLSIPRAAESRPRRC
jgi:hypothetical protein